MSVILTGDSLQTLTVDYDALQLINKQQALTDELFFFQHQGKTLSLLTTNNYPKIYHTILQEYIEKGYNVNSFFTDKATFEKALQRYDQRENERSVQNQRQQAKVHAVGQEAVDLLKEAYAKRATYTEGGFLEELLKLSYQAHASDVHFQTEEQGVQMRIRKDGLLQPICLFSHEEFAKYLMKIKFMAGAKMNISNHSQDGRFQIQVNKNNQSIALDIRASFLPGLRGESIVLRFLDETAGIKSLEELGMQPRHTSIVNKELQQHHGLILVAGPTGSGKTTTVYTLLNLLNSPEKKIITLEDPVEYEIDGVTQSQINDAAGYTFEEGLKGILRHDPDIIVVGEMRTLASAQLAINAAITGHLVISTIHTNSAIEAVSRLLNMGIPPFMLSASLNCIIGQRLVRKVIHPQAVELPEGYNPFVQDLLKRFHHVVPNAPLPDSSHLYTLPESTVDSYYRGRIGIFECVHCSPEIKQAILDDVGTLALQHMVDEGGFLAMNHDAWLKMFSQQTTLEEIERVI